MSRSSQTSRAWERGGGAPRAIGVVSAAGGAARARVVANLAAALADLGPRVCLLDAGGGAERALGIAPGPALTDVLAGAAALDDTFRQGPAGVTLVALDGAPTAPQLSELALLGAVDALEQDFDVVLLDTPPGLGGAGAFFARAASQVLLLATPDARGGRQAEALLRQLALRCGCREIFLLALPGVGDAAGASLWARLARLGLQAPHLAVHGLGALAAEAASAPAAGHAGAPGAPALAAAATALLARVPAPSGGLRFFFHSSVTHGRAA